MKIGENKNEEYQTLVKTYRILQNPCLDWKSLLLTFLMEQRPYRLQEPGMLKVSHIWDGKKKDAQLLARICHPTFIDKALSTDMKEVEKIYKSHNAPFICISLEDIGKFEGVKMGSFVPYPSHCIRVSSDPLFIIPEVPMLLSYLSPEKCYAPIH